MVWYWEGKCCNSDQTDPSHFLRPMLMGHEKPLWCSHKYEFYPCIIFLRLCWNGQSPTFTQIQVGPRWCTETSCVRAVAMQVVREGFTSSLSSMLPPLESQRRNACQTQPLWLLNCFGVSWRRPSRSHCVSTTERTTRIFRGENFQIWEKTKQSSIQNTVFF